jgi:hypothetical protein
LFFHAKIIIAEHLIIGPERALEANTKRIREQCEKAHSPESFPANAGLTRVASPRMH